jgi:hypothetical protein
MCPLVMIHKKTEEELRVFCQELLASELIDNFDELSFRGVSGEFEV